MKNTRLMIILSIAAVILLIPFVAMQFTDEVMWESSDFFIMGMLLLGVSLMIELVMRTVKSLKNRLIVCGVILFAFLFIWAELAVGIVGTPFAGS